MRLHTKLLLSTFLLFEIVVVTAGVALIEHSFRQVRDREVTAALAEHSSIQTGLQLAGEVVAQNAPLESGFFTDFLGASFQNYLSGPGRSNAQVVITTADGSEVFSSVTVPSEPVRVDAAALDPGTRQYAVRRAGDDVYLVSASLLDIAGTAYVLTYLRDISAVYAFRMSQYQTLLAMNLLLSLMLGGGLSVILGYFTRPIDDLTRSSQAIAEGDYAHRALVMTKDELGELADAFNIMASAIQTNVCDLERVSEAQQYFIASLTHEIHTPLTSIIGYAEYLRDTAYDPQALHKGMNYIHAEALRLNSLSERLMELIVLRHGELVLQPHDLAEVYAELREGVLVQAATRELTITENIESVSAPIDIDLVKLVFINLVSNAVNASQPGGALAISVVGDSPSTVTVTISDTGSGIPEEQIEHLTEPFFVARGDRAQTRGGMGLGLEITKTVVEAHGGRFIIKSELGKGTSASVVLSR